MKRMYFPDRVDQRRKEAVIRQAEYDALTSEQKVARAHTSPGRSKRELIRLNAWTEAA
jgi:hypothetical protein